MERTPIIIITRDNPEYLYVTLKSLTATELMNNPILIVDDSSQLDLTRKFYYTMDEYPVTFDDWTKPGKSSQEIYDKKFGHEFLYIPQITKIKGIKRKFQVISTPKTLGPDKILFYAMKAAFTIFPESTSCCILDDNILFNSKWLKKTLEIYQDERFHSKIGIISVYSETEIIHNCDYHFDHDAFKGKMMFINKNLYKEMTYIGWFKNNVKLPGDFVNYKELQRIADSLGYITITTDISYIQSLEKRNLCGKDKILKYQNNFKYPVAWNENF